MKLTDESKMPFGKYKDEKMINVPASYLMWLYDTGKCNSDVKEYIKDNLDVIKKQSGIKQTSIVKSPGKLVVTKNGERGRTYNSKGIINGKLPVYLEIDKFKYQETAILCDPTTLQIIGFID